MPGAHIIQQKQDSSIFKSIRNVSLLYPSLTCCQIFLGGKYGNAGLIKAFNKDGLAGLAAFDKIRNKITMPIYVHCSYNAVLSGTQRARDNIIKQLQICDYFHLSGYIVHEAKRSDIDTISFVHDIYDDYKFTTPLFIEHKVIRNNPHALPSSLLKLVMSMRLALSIEHIGACIDTCHMWAMGLPPLTLSQLKPMHRQLGPYLLVHLNDSQQQQGSNMDRHAPLGKTIWPLPLTNDALGALLKYLKRAKIDYILEGKNNDYSDELRIIQHWISTT